MRTRLWAKRRWHGAEIYSMLRVIILTRGVETMDKRLSIIIAVVALLVVAACTSQATPASTAGYTEINAAQLNEMLQAKDFTLINVHIP